MKNFKIQPFEKNNYFYGKLLTVRDFQAEQKYNDEKRWLINKFMFGSGIVAGLKVVMIDEHTISIEPGIAIDNSGKEIVVSSPITQKLSLMDGFENTGYSKAVYMCIDYEDKGNEKIQAITNTEEDTEDEISSYNRIQEKFKLYLRENIPDEDERRTSSLISNRVCILDNEKIKIFVTIPKYVSFGEEYDVVTEIVKKEILCKIEFSLTGYTNHSVLNSDYNKNKFKIDFLESPDNLSSYYCIRHKMKAEMIAEKNAYFEILLELVRIEGKQIDVLSKIVLNYKVVSDKMKILLKDYNDKSFETITEDDYNTIYIAKINLLKVEHTYLIKDIINCPFDQYIYNTRLMSNLLKENMMNSKNGFAIKTAVHKSNFINSPDVDVEIDDRGTFVFNFTFPEEEINKSNFSTGETLINIEEPVNSPKVFYSKETEHGLGVGEVFIQTSCVTEDNLEDAMVCGDQDILGNSNVTIKSAAIIYPQKGTFKIAVKVDFAYVGYRVKIRWLAMANK